MVSENKPKRIYKQFKYIGFQMILTFTTHSLRTQKSHFFLVLLPIFGGHKPTNEPTTSFINPNTNFNVGEFYLLWRILKTNFTPETFVNFGSHWGLLGFRGLNSYFTLGEFFLLGSLPNSSFTLGLLPILGPMDLLWFRGSKSIFISVAFTHRLGPKL
jgi:hypothetical protein